MTIDFTGAAELIDSAARIVKTLTEAIRDSIKSGIETVDIVSARKAEKRLADIHRRGLHLVVQQGIMIVPSAENYIRLPNETNWREVREAIQTTLNDVENITTDLEALRGDFILEESYLALLNAMKQREIALKGVLELTKPPSTTEELDNFKTFLQNYIVLIRALQQLGITIGGYLRSRK